MDQKFPTRLSDLLRQRQLTQAEFAKRISTGQSTISQWLGGTSTPRPKTVIQIAEALRVNPAWLVTGDGDPEPVPGSGPDRQTIVTASGHTMTLRESTRQILLMAADALGDPVRLSPAKLLTTAALQQIQTMMECTEPAAPATASSNINE